MHGKLMIFRALKRHNYIFLSSTMVALFLPTQVMILMSVLYPASASKCVPTLRDHSLVDVRQDMCWTVTEHHVLVHWYTFIIMCYHVISSSL